MWAYHIGMFTNIVHVGMFMYVLHTAYVNKYQKHKHTLTLYSLMHPHTVCKSSVSGDDNFWPVRKGQGTDVEKF